MFGMSAIVTGAASGLGRAAAAKLANRGAGVVIFDLPKSEGDAVAKVKLIKTLILSFFVSPKLPDRFLKFQKQ